MKEKSLRNLVEDLYSTNTRSWNIKALINMELRNIKKLALKNYSGVECTVEPVEMSTLVESMKQEAQPIALGVGE